ncbi:rho guanine nucleotide exchange factor [Pelomyxa schiedti]|nr:rho guanine nucleotide exchange factor [Pelomyxa schiedti]
MSSDTSPASIPVSGTSSDLAPQPTPTSTETHDPIISSPRAADPPSSSTAAPLADQPGGAPHTPTTPPTPSPTDNATTPQTTTTTTPTQQVPTPTSSPSSTVIDYDADTIVVATPRGTRHSYSRHHTHSTAASTTSTSTTGSSGSSSSGGANRSRRRSTTAAVAAPAAAPGLVARTCTSTDPHPRNRDDDGGDQAPAATAAETNQPLADDQGPQQPQGEAQQARVAQTRTRSDAVAVVAVDLVIAEMAAAAAPKCKSPSLASSQKHKQKQHQYHSTPPASPPLSSKMMITSMPGGDSATGTADTNEMTSGDKQQPQPQTTTSTSVPAASVCEGTPNVMSKDRNEDSQSDDDCDTTGRPTTPGGSGTGGSGAAKKGSGHSTRHSKHRELPIKLWDEETGERQRPRSADPDGARTKTPRGSQREKDSRDRGENRRVRVPGLQLGVKLDEETPNAEGNHKKDSEDCGTPKKELAATGTVETAPETPPSTETSSGGVGDSTEHGDETPRHRHHQKRNTTPQALHLLLPENRKGSRAISPPSGAADGALSSHRSISQPLLTKGSSTLTLLNDPSQQSLLPKALATKHKSISEKKPGGSDVNGAGGNIKPKEVTTDIPSGDSQDLTQRRAKTPPEGSDSSNEAVDPEYRKLASPNSTPNASPSSTPTLSFTAIPVPPPPPPPPSTPISAKPWMFRKLFGSKLTPSPSTPVTQPPSVPKNSSTSPLDTASTESKPAFISPFPSPSFQPTFIQKLQQTQAAGDSGFQPNPKSHYKRYSLQQSDILSRPTTSTPSPLESDGTSKMKLAFLTIVFPRFQTKIIFKPQLTLAATLQELLHKKDIFVNNQPRPELWSFYLPNSTTPVPMDTLMGTICSDKLILKERELEEEEEEQEDEEENQNQVDTEDTEEDSSDKSAPSPSTATPAPLTKMQKAMRELITTEKQYVEDLSIVVEVFIQPLLEQHIVTQDLIQQLFGTIEFILPYHKKLLRDIIEGSTEKLASSFTKLNGYYPKLVSDFLTNYPASIQLLNKKMQKGAFRSFIQEALKHPRLMGLKLEDKLITPVQRTVQYTLVLNSLLKHTDPSHPDYAEIESAYETAKAIASKVDEISKDAANLAKVQEIQGKIPSSSSVKLLCPPQKYIKDEVLTEQVETKIGTVNRRVHYYLLSNSVLRFSNFNALKSYIPMDCLYIADILEERKGLFSFSLCHVGNMRFTLVFTTLAAKLQWKTALQDQIDAKIAETKKIKQSSDGPPPAPAAPPATPPSNSSALTLDDSFLPKANIFDDSQLPKKFSTVRLKRNTSMAVSRQLPPTLIHGLPPKLKPLPLLPTENQKVPLRFKCIYQGGIRYAGRIRNDAGAEPAASITATSTATTATTTSTAAQPRKLRRDRQRHVVVRDVDLLQRIVVVLGFRQRGLFVARVAVPPATAAAVVVPVFAEVGVAAVILPAGFRRAVATRAGPTITVADLHHRADINTTIIIINTWEPSQGTLPQALITHTFYIFTTFVYITNSSFIFIIINYTPSCKHNNISKHIRKQRHYYKYKYKYKYNNSIISHCFGCPRFADNYIQASSFKKEQLKRVQERLFVS